MSTEIQGGCLCGRVRFAMQGPVERFYLCYCSRCRRATGSAHAANMLVDPGQFRWLAGEDAVQVHDLAGAQFFSRAFCRSCGAPVPRISRRDGSVVIPAGTLDQDPAVRAPVRIYCADQAEWSKDLDALAAFPGPPG